MSIPTWSYGAEDFSNYKESDLVVESMKSSEPSITNTVFSESDSVVNSTGSSVSSDSSSYYESNLSIEKSKASLANSDELSYFESSNLVGSESIVHPEFSTYTPSDKKVGSFCDPKSVARNFLPKTKSTTILSTAVSIDDPAFHCLNWKYDPGMCYQEGTYFKISASLNPKNSFEFISENIMAKPSADPVSVSHLIKVNDFHRSHFYRVYAYLPDGTEISVGKLAFIGESINGIHDTILWAEDLVRRNYTGTPFLHLQKQTSGKRCTCWSVERQQLLFSDHDVCKGTGFIGGGYYSAVEFRLDMSPDPKQTNVGTDGNDKMVKIRGRTGRFPVIKPGDVVADKTIGKIYVVTGVDMTGIPVLSSYKKESTGDRATLSQVVTLDELESDCTEYNTVFSMINANVSELK